MKRLPSSSRPHTHTRPHTLILALALTLTLFSSCQVGRYVLYNFADIKDYKKFPSRTLHRDTTTTFTFHDNAAAYKVPKTITDKNKQTPFDSYLEQNKTVAFLIIQNDTIRYERYFKGYNKNSIVPSFSMAKSVTSILIGCALEDGLITSVHDPITKYLPELEKNGLGEVTIEHLLQMTSGIKFNESYYNPFGDAAAYYYGRTLRKRVGRMKPGTKPGTQFAYSSGSTQVLGAILEQVLKGKTITQYLQEKLWTPMNMEYDATWSIDRKNNGLEKTFCCINARARDFAKIGRLYLNNGNWNGRQLVPSQWVTQSRQPDTTNGGVPYYKYQWWLPTTHGDFMAQGFLGQFIYVNPTKKMIIVRLGRNSGDINWWQFLPSIAAAY